MLSQRKKTRTWHRGNRVIKSAELSEDNKDHRSAKATEVMRDNEYSGRMECSGGQL